MRFDKELQKNTYREASVFVTFTVLWYTDTLILMGSIAVIE
jgi:hypothetical protein